MPESVTSCYLCNSGKAKTIFVKQPWRLVRCQRCGLIYLSPRPSEAEVQQFYSKNSYHNSLINDPQVQQWHRRRAERQINEVERFCGRGRILDVVCSTGIFLETARQRGWETLGVELSSYTSEYARKAYGLSVITGTLKSAEFPSGFFDVVTLWSVLEHLLDPSDTLQEIRRILRDGGFLFIFCPNIDGLFPQITRILFGKTIGFWEADNIPYHIYEFSKQALGKLLRKTTFKIIELKTKEIPVGDFYDVAGCLGPGGRRRVAKEILRVIYRLLFAVIYPIARRLDMNNALLAVCTKQ